MVFPDTATLTSELDTDTIWARDLPMLNPKLKLMPNPVTDTAMDMVMDTDMVITDTDTVMVDMDTITAKDPLNPVMVMVVMPTILMVEAHTLDVPSGVWEN